MFYSQTFLARKGPLGTVWCAAHLQHKLNKSHYTQTNIPITVDRIMYPEVPIALRMSGHLLLGVVRIYSKQVEYFFQDCNILLAVITKAYASTNVNLPENATHATLDTVTLPDNFQLDALDIDDNYLSGRFHDYHLRNQEEITLEDQVPVGQDPYIAITLIEDLDRNPLFLEDMSGSGPRPMEEDTNALAVVDAISGAQDPTFGYNGDNIPIDLPEVEVLRTASIGYLYEDVPFWPNNLDDQLEPDTVLMEVMKEKGTPTVTMDMVSGGPILSMQREEQISAASEQSPGFLDSHNKYTHDTPELAVRLTPLAEQKEEQHKELVSAVLEQDHVFRNMTPELAVRSTPLAEQQANDRTRKKKQNYDEVTILSNRFMKQWIDKSTDILRTRKQCPCTALGLWKLNKRLKKDTMFSEPLMTGLCNDLSNTYKEDLISAKSYLALVEEASLAVPESSALVHDSNLEIEHLRNYEIPVGTTTSIPQSVQSPNIASYSPSRTIPSPTTGDEYTPAIGTDMSLQSEKVETTARTTPDLSASTAALRSDVETPLTSFEEQLVGEDTCLFDNTKSGNSGDGDLSFLEEDDYTAAGSQGTPNYFIRKHTGTSEVETLSARARAVALFFKKKSSVTPVPDQQSADLSLNKILEGKRKKICARMVFETLVLKNSGLVDVQQEEPFGDIALKVMPKLSNEQFCS